MSESHSVVSDSATPRTVARQSPLFKFSRQESWSGLPFPSPGDLPNPGIKPGSPAIRADSIPPEPPGKPPIFRQWSLDQMTWGDRASSGRLRLPVPPPTEASGTESRSVLSHTSGAQASPAGRKAEPLSLQPQPCWVRELGVSVGLQEAGSWPLRSERPGPRVSLLAPSQQAQLPAHSRLPALSEAPRPTVKTHHSCLGENSQSRQDLNGCRCLCPCSPEPSVRLDKHLSIPPHGRGARDRCSLSVQAVPPIVGLSGCSYSPSSHAVGSPPKPQLCTSILRPWVPWGPSTESPHPTPTQFSATQRNASSSLPPGDLGHTPSLQPVSSSGKVPGQEVTSGDPLSLTWI